MTEWTRAGVSEQRTIGSSPGGPGDEAHGRERRKAASEPLKAPARQPGQPRTPGPLEPPGFTDGAWNTDNEDPSSEEQMEELTVVGREIRAF